MTEERKLLIIEDEKKIATTLKKGLTENGYHVDIAFDGNIGKRLFDSNEYDLIILDINLPGMNGFEVCKAIRNSNQQIPIIMLNSKGLIK